MLCSGNHIISRAIWNKYTREMVDVLHEKKRDYLAVLFRKKIVMAFHDYAEATHANHVQKLSLNLANVTLSLFKTTVLLKTTISMLFCFSLGFFLVYCG